MTQQPNKLRIEVAGDLISREAGKALVDEANRWQKVADRAMKDRAILVEAMERIAESRHMDTSRGCCPACLAHVTLEKVGEEGR